MPLFDLIAVFIALAAGFSYLNLKLLKLPMTIGLMTLSLLFSLSLFVLGRFYPAVTQEVRLVVEHFSFDQALLHGMLGFLLFAGALHINLEDLVRLRWAIAVLATVGVLISTLIVGLLMWGVFTLLGFPLRFIDCLLFGALISPTDPVAVLSLLKQIGAPSGWRYRSPANHCSMMVSASSSSWACSRSRRAKCRSTWATSAFCLPGRPAAVRLFGLAIGIVAYQMLKSVDNYQVEILLSVALVLGWFGTGRCLARFRAAGDGRGRAPDWQSGTQLRHVSDHDRAPGPVLGNGRRIPQRRSVRGDRTGTAGPDFFQIVPGGRVAGRTDRAGRPPRERRLARLVVTEFQPVRLIVDRYLDLGRTARRHLGRAGTIVARRLARRTDSQA